jgi:4-amino-4-deoxy-L-arabinose transferase-like glycosyltransferase
MTSRPGSSGWSAGDWIALGALLLAFCLPLFIGLRNWDIKSDEAIYAYAIERMLETGDWLTPRGLRTDTPFLEKPPLKLWLVAAAMRLGWLPHDEFGFRFLDALFGTVAFVYVFRFGLRLGTWLCGLVAALVLITFFSFVFNHGLRSNNMDAALVLAYCGGLFHFARWVESGARRSRDAAATVAYFTLGFLAKFVAVAFLPLICALSVAWRPAAERPARARWREWIAPLAVAVLIIVPWFVYQTARNDLWQTIWQEQVYRRFTGVLDPRQLLPWHYYISQVATEARAAGSHWIVILGLAMLVVTAWRGRSWMAKLLLLWLVVPFAVLSLGTAKWVHYTYPFLPPLALAAGMAADALVRVMRRAVDPVVAAIPGRLESVDRVAARLPGALRTALVVIGVVAVVVSGGPPSRDGFAWKSRGLRCYEIQRRFDH